MLSRPLSILALVSQLFACGQKEHSETPAAASSPQPAKYPRSMPSSTLDDVRLIGYWETLCEVSNLGSSRWSFLLDPTKAVLEKQVYQDNECQQAAHTTRFYLTYTTENDRIEGRIWEVHAHFQTTDRWNAIVPSQTCSLLTVRDDIWYDLTGTGCQLNDDPRSLGRGSPLISSRYGFNLNRRQLILDLEGQPGLKFIKKD